MPDLRVPLTAALLFTSHLIAHGGGYIPPPPPPGGQYRGPGDVVPNGGSGPGGSGPATPGPSGPSTPGPGKGGGGGSGGKAAAPAVTGGPSGPSGPTVAPAATPGARGPTTGGGMPLEEDYDSWDYWWEFNKDRFLRLRDEVHSGVQTGSDDFYLGSTRRAEARDVLRPNVDQVVSEVLPALRRAIDETTHRDIASACLVAMAKVARDHAEFSLLEQVRPQLRAGDQEVRETAALALGIGARGDAATMALLEGLALDTPVGRAARDGTVDERTRAFATYGLGLAVQRRPDDALAARVLDVCKQLLSKPESCGRDTRIAAVHAIGLLAPQRRSHAGEKLLDEAVAVLDAYLLRDLGPGEEYVQAHCPTAMAKLVGSQDLRSERCRERFLGVLRAHERSNRRGNPIMQSCALALGRMLPRLDPGTKVADDAGARALLLEVSREHPDRLTRNFALVALAQAGGGMVHETLLEEFERSKNVQRRAWCALALGLLVHGDRAAATHDVSAGAAPALVSSRLFAALREAKEPGLVGALGLALGLCGATEAATELQLRMREGVAKEKMAGYLCIGLALMGERRAIDDIRQVASMSARRPELLIQTAVALGRLGDKALVPDLLEWMTGSEVNVARLAAIATALARIGDSRSIAPLVRMLHDKSLGTLPRAFAAVALGGVCDGRDLPWNTPIAADVNYRATVPTLSDQSTGILDIL